MLTFFIHLKTNRHDHGMKSVKKNTQNIKQAKVETLAKSRRVTVNINDTHCHKTCHDLQKELRVMPTARLLTICYQNQVFSFRFSYAIRYFPRGNLLGSKRLPFSV